MSSFTKADLQKTAGKMIEEQNIIQLSASDSKAFAETLLNPPSPGKTLRSAVKRYKKRSK